MAVRGLAGGIWALLDLIEEHRAAFDYDWRTRFHLSLERSVPDDMGWAEAVRVAGILRRDPSSAITASMEGWENPITREALLLMDVYDLTMAANTDAKKRPKPHPGRPFKSDGSEISRKGNAGDRTPEQVKELLARMRMGEPTEPTEV